MGDPENDQLADRDVGIRGQVQVSVLIVQQPLTATRDPTGSQLAVAPDEQRHRQAGVEGGVPPAEADDGPARFR